MTPGGPADDAGIQPGDYIVAIDNHYIFTVEDLADEVRQLTPGSKVNIRYRRYSTIYDTYIVMGHARSEGASQH
jgi:putative serine protease PepD